MNVSSDVYLEDNSGGVLLAARVSAGSCALRSATGVYLWISEGKYEVTIDHGKNWKNRISVLFCTAQENVCHGNKNYPYAVGVVGFADLTDQIVSVSH